MSNFKKAQNVIPGGVNSPVRALGSLGVEPPFVKSAKGQFFTAESEETYLDFCMSWGALLFGHSYEPVVHAVREAIVDGTSYGIPTKKETELAEKICAMVPSIEKVRLVSSGTEAGMSAIRLARGFTKRPIIVKFDGCYHGHSDSLLVSAGSGVSELPQSFSAGVPNGIIENTISIPYNDINAITKLFKEKGTEIAGVIVEPVAGNMGLVVPEEAWLQELRKLTAAHDSLLIFDEVISGFRVAPGGAQELFDITPDLTCLGKIVGGGFPVAAFGGKAEIMDHMAPLGDVYQAGTLSGNPIAVTAGLTMLNEIDRNRGFYETSADLVKDFAAEAANRFDGYISYCGSMFTIFHTPNPVRNAADAHSQDESSFKKLWLNAYENNIYLPPSMFETAFISLAHSGKDLEKMLRIL